MAIFHNYVLNNDDLDEIIVALYNLRENCFNCNVSIEPMQETFSQCGEYQIHRYFTQIILNELDRKI